MTPPVDHLDLVVSSLERSLDFYRGLLVPLGWERERAIVGERGERVVYLSAGEGALSLRERQSGYYAVFFYDPDGIKLEIVHRPPAR